METESYLFILIYTKWSDKHKEPKYKKKMKFEFCCSVIHNSSG